MKELEYDHELITFEEVVDEFPKAAIKCHWTKAQFTAYIKGKILIGIYDTTLRTYLFERASVVKMIKLIQVNMQESSDLL